LGGSTTIEGLRASCWSSFVSEVSESTETVSTFHAKSKQAFANFVLLRNLHYRLFILAPETKVLFGFPIDADPRSDALVKNPKFIMHAAYVVRMFDSVLSTLGPDFELLEEVSTDLGIKHVRFGVTEAMVGHMGVALIETLEEQLPNKEFNETVKTSWKKAYATLSEGMVNALAKARASSRQ
jgi:hypothetical protein